MLIDVFNEAFNNKLISYLKVEYYSMSAICLRATAKENLPHFPHVFRNPETKTKSSIQLPFLSQRNCY